MITNKWVEHTGDYQDAKSVRTAVFVEEQSIPLEEEFDAEDEIAHHLVLYDGGTPCATGRIYLKDAQTAVLGRICVLKPFRGQHLGDLLVRLLIQKALKLRAHTLELSAQAYVVPFYEKFGFQTVGGGYMEVDIPHQHMRVSADDIFFPRACDQAQSFKETKGGFSDA